MQSVTVATQLSVSRDNAVAGNNDGFQAPDDLHVCHKSPFLADHSAREDHTLVCNLVARQRSVRAKP